MGGDHCCCAKGCQLRSHLGCTAFDNTKTTFDVLTQECMFSQSFLGPLLMYFLKNFQKPDTGLIFKVNSFRLGLGLSVY